MLILLFPYFPMGSLPPNSCFKGTGSLGSNTALKAFQAANDHYILQAGHVHLCTPTQVPSRLLKGEAGPRQKDMLPRSSAPFLNKIYMAQVDRFPM